MQDARAVANAVLDAAVTQGLRVSNLKLQKLLFFVHGQYLLEVGEPLIAGEFEAWQHGPVHPLAYEAFRDWGARDIDGRASRLDPVTRLREIVPAMTDPNALRYVYRITASLGTLSASRLRALTHKDGGPWQQTVQSASTSANLGMKIKTDMIRQCFATLTVVRALGEEEDASRGDLIENTPYS